MSRIKVLSQATEHVVLLLPFTLGILTDPKPLLPIISQAVNETQSRSLLVLFSTSQAGTSSHGQLYSQLRANPSVNFELFQRFLGRVYAALAAAQWSCGKVLMDVEVAFEGEAVSIPAIGGAQTIRLQGYENLPTALELQPTSAVLPFSPPPPSNTVHLPSASVLTQRTVALGGTFDHLHAAHKLLLQLSLFLCTRRLIVGVMADSKLTSKTNADLIEPLDKRIQTIQEFLERLGAKRKLSTSQGPTTEEHEDDGRVVMDVVEITDPYGPTAWDEDIQALVVSQETLSGGGMVNTLRKEKGLPQLEVFVVDVIAAEVSATDAAGGSGSRDLTDITDESVLKELKMGSTGIRRWIKDHPEAK